MINDVINVTQYNLCDPVLKYKLMIKSHWETGINYLCITKRSNWKDYKGSGKRWISILNKYPSSIHTILLHTSDDLDQFNDVCKIYSEMFDVVNNKDFANLIPENGYDGNLDAWNKQQIPGYISGCCSKEWMNNNRETQLKNSALGGKIGGKVTGSMSWWNNGTINTRSQTCPGEGWVNEMLMSDKKKAQVYGAMRNGKRNIEKTNCQFCNKISFVNKNTKHEQYCYANPNKLYREAFRCEFCNVEVSTQNYTRWHGNKCKHKGE